MWTIIGGTIWQWSLRPKNCCFSATQVPCNHQLLSPLNHSLLPSPVHCTQLHTKTCTGGGLGMWTTVNILFIYTCRSNIFSPHGALIIRSYSCVPGPHFLLPQERVWYARSKFFAMLSQQSVSQSDYRF